VVVVATVLVVVVVAVVFEFPANNAAPKTRTIAATMVIITQRRSV
jgi:hypothetical protein